MKDENGGPPHRLLQGVLTIRDVCDVERHVAAYFEGLSLPAAQLRATVLGAVGDAYRIDRALPPERPLVPVLDAVLEMRAARLHSRIGPLGHVA